MLDLDKRAGLCFCMGGEAVVSGQGGFSLEFPPTIEAAWQEVTSTARWSDAGGIAAEVHLNIGGQRHVVRQSE